MSGDTLKTQNSKVSKNNLLHVTCYMLYDSNSYMINYQKHQLANGLTVITAPMKETKAVSILVLVKVGSRYESKQENGIAHFLEHMFFKGTIKRPISLDISRQLDALGAEYNAFTSEEYTGFYISLSADHFTVGLDILADILLNSQFNVKEINKEKGVILEEINMYRDLPQKHVQDLAKEQLYGDTPLGRSVLGRANNIRAFSRQDFLNYFHRHYSAQNTIIAVAGNQNKSDWLAEINKRLSKLAKGQANQYPKNAIKQNQPVIKLHYKKTDQAHLLISWRAFHRFDPRRYQLKVLSNLFGGMMSSRLFSEIREKRGLAYYVGSSRWEFADTGAFFAVAGLDIKRLDEALQVIMEEFQKLKKEKISSEEIERSKENIKGGFYLNLEDSFAIAEFLADQQLLFGQIKNPEEIIEEVFKVNDQEILALCQEILQPANLNLTIIGPFKENNKLKKLLTIN